MDIFIGKIFITTFLVNMTILVVVGAVTHVLRTLGRIKKDEKTYAFKVAGKNKSEYYVSSEQQLTVDELTDFCDIIGVFEQKQTRRENNQKTDKLKEEK